MGIQVKADEASVLEQDSGRQKLTISTIIHTGALGVWDIHGAIHGLHSVILTWSPNREQTRADLSAFRRAGTARRVRPKGAKGRAEACGTNPLW